MSNKEITIACLPYSNIETMRKLLQSYDESSNEERLQYAKHIVCYVRMLVKQIDRAKVKEKCGTRSEWEQMIVNELYDKDDLVERKPEDVI